MLTAGVILAVVLSLWYMAVIVFLRWGLRHLVPPGASAGLTYSVVIAARNEETNIGPCLERVLDQSIAPERFEVIVVDDRSEDRTAEIVRGFAARDSRVRLVRVTEVPVGVSPKKNALTQGIAAARNEIIACTDADCRVARDWLTTIDRYFDRATGLVQGMSIYARPAGMNEFLYAFQTLDFVSHGVVAAAGIGSGLPLNANGNNIAYRRTVFHEVGGFGEGAAVLLGDDDLLMQRVWQTGKWKVRFMGERAAAVETEPAPSFAAMFAQRCRWGSVSVHYGWRQQALLAGFFVFYLGILGALFAGIGNASLLAVGTGMLGVKLAGEFVMMVPGTRLYGCRGLLPWLPLVSLVHLPVVVAAVIAGVAGKHRWKGQTMRGRVGGRSEA